MEMPSRSGGKAYDAASTGPVRFMDWMKDGCPGLRVDDTCGPGGRHLTVHEIKGELIQTYAFIREFIKSGGKEVNDKMGADDFYIYPKYRYLVWKVDRKLEMSPNLDKTEEECNVILKQQRFSGSGPYETPRIRFHGTSPSNIHSILRTRMFRGIRGQTTVDNDVFYGVFTSRAIWHAERFSRLSSQPADENTVNEDRWDFFDFNQPYSFIIRLQVCRERSLNDTMVTWEPFCQVDGLLFRPYSLRIVSGPYKSVFEKTCSPRSHFAFDKTVANMVTTISPLMQSWEHNAWLQGDRSVDKPKSLEIPTESIASSSESGSSSYDSSEEDNGGAGKRQNDQRSDTTDGASSTPPSRTGATAGGSSAPPSPPSEEDPKKDGPIAAIAKRTTKSKGAPVNRNAGTCTEDHMRGLALRQSALRHELQDRFDEHGRKHRTTVRSTATVRHDQGTHSDNPPASSHERVIQMKSESPERSIKKEDSSQESDLDECNVGRRDRIRQMQDTQRGARRSPGRSARRTERPPRLAHRPGGNHSSSGYSREKRARLSYGPSQKLDNHNRRESSDENKEYISNWCWRAQVDSRAMRMLRAQPMRLQLRICQHPLAAKGNPSALLVAKIQALSSKR